MSLPKFPKFKTRVAARRIPIGTRLLMVGEDLRTAMSAGPMDASPAERAVYGWLVRFDIPFMFQQPILGGRAVPGGAVVDFVILFDPPIALRVMSYWHTDPSAVEIDEVQRIVLEQEGFRVVDIWEWDTIDWTRMSRILEQLLFGYQPVFAKPFAKPDYVPPQPDCPYEFDDVCFGIDC